MDEHARGGAANIGEIPEHVPVGSADALHRHARGTLGRRAPRRPRPLGRGAPAGRRHVNGLPFRSRLAVYGGETVLGLTNAFRAEAGIVAGDEVEVVIDRDDAPREIEVPPELRAALDGDDEARAAFDALSFTHRREYAQWVAEAKREETRERRAARALEMLRAGEDPMSVEVRDVAAGPVAVAPAAPVLGARRRAGIPRCRRSR